MKKKSKGETATQISNKTSQILQAADQSANKTAASLDGNTLLTAIHLQLQRSLAAADTQCCMLLQLIGPLISSDLFRNCSESGQ